MSVRVLKLTSPTTYDEVHLHGYQELADGSAVATIRFVMAPSRVSGNPITIAAITLVAWLENWDPNMRIKEEHILACWAQANSYVGTLGAASKGG